MKAVHLPRPPRHLCGSPDLLAATETDLPIPGGKTEFYGGIEIVGSHIAREGCSEDPAPATLAPRLG